MASELQARLADGKLAGAWTLDGARSSVGLSSKSMWNMVKVKGRFTQVTGAAAISAAGEATGTITVAAASVDTGIKKRDDHLRSADFFDAAKYPDISASHHLGHPVGRRRGRRLRRHADRARPDQAGHRQRQGLGAGRG